MINILKTETLHDIILALTSIVKTPNKIVNLTSKKILIKVLEKFKLEKYKKIQIITKGKCYDDNGTFGNCTNNKDFTEEDLNLFGLFSF